MVLDDLSLPPTQQLPAADKTEILLAELKVLMVSGFKELDGKVDHLEANSDLLNGEIGLVKKEVALIFEWKSDVDTRLKTNSLRAQSASQADSEQSSQLAQEREAREALATKVDELTTSQSVQLAILHRLDAITSNPQVKIILTIAATAMASWAASKGFK